LVMYIKFCNIYWLLVSEHPAASTNVCKVYVEPEQVRQCRHSIYNLESGKDGTTRMATL
jgi:hypothetical protein